MENKKGLDGMMAQIEKNTKTYQYAPIPTNLIETALAEMWSIKAEADDLHLQFFAQPRTDREVEEVIADPESGYHKILSGYWYSAESGTKINTGHGGAKMLYKMFLKEGMTDEMVQEVIYIYLDDKGWHPLAALKIEKRNGSAD